MPPIINDPVTSHDTGPNSEYRRYHAEVRQLDGEVAIVFTDQVADLLRLPAGTVIDVVDHDTRLEIALEPSKRPTLTELLKDFHPDQLPDRCDTEWGPPVGNEVW